MDGVEGGRRGWRKGARITLHASKACYSCYVNAKSATTECNRIRIQYKYTRKQHTHTRAAQSNQIVLHTNTNVLNT